LERLVLAFRALRPGGEVVLLLLWPGRGRRVAVGAWRRLEAIGLRVLMGVAEEVVRLHWVGKTLDSSV